jgi:hypothetical protein
LNFTRRYFLEMSPLQVSTDIPLTEYRLDVVSTRITEILTQAGSTWTAPGRHCQCRQESKNDNSA